MAVVCEQGVLQKHGGFGDSGPLALVKSQGCRGVCC